MTCDALQGDDPSERSHLRRNQTFSDGLPCSMRQACMADDEEPHSFRQISKLREMKE